jgi:transcriptional regulator with XRE-family HTH domain
MVTLSVMSKPSEKPTARQWAARLKRLREMRGLTQRQAADLAGLPMRTWISWENRQHVPNEFVRAALAKIFPELS